MSQAKFVLKEPNSKERTLIYLFYNFNYKRLKYSTGEKIVPEYWNSQKQRAKITKAFPEHFELNNRLNLIENSINTIYRKLLNDNQTPTPKLLRQELNNTLKGEVKVKKPNFVTFIKCYIDEAEQSKSKDLINAYKSLYNRLLEFSKSNNYQVDFENIDIGFYTKFTDFLLYEKDFLNNTVGKYVKNLKLILKEATERGLNKNLAYRKFKVLKDEPYTIYLNDNELEKIHLLPLETKRTLEKVRDLFLVGCFTGLRFSDFANINEDIIIRDDEKSLIKVRTQKTDETVIIPIHPVVESIYTKYNNGFPKPLSNQKMNIHLKEIGMLAEIDELVKIKKIQGQKSKSVTVKKYELISTHTARRSFATNMYLAGIPTLSIMLITGHKTEKAFLRYIRVTKEQNAKNLLEHPYFK